MKGLLLKLLAKKITKRLKKSATAAVGTGIFGIGVLDAISPEMIEAIPAPVRDYALIGLGVLVILARVRKEITEAFRDAKAGIDSE